MIRVLLTGGTFLLALAAPAFCQSAPAAAVPAYALNTTGLKAPGFFFALRNGLFENIQLTPRAPIFHETYRNYVYAYGQACRKQLPEGAVELTEKKCSHSHSEVTRRGVIVVGSQDVCDAWTDVPTGVFADPRFIRRYYLTVSEAREAYGSIPDPDLVLSAGKDIAMLKADIAELLRQNECTSPDIKLFNENLLRFSNGEQPFQRASEGSAIKSLYSGCMASQPKGTSNMQWISYCRCIDRQYENVLTPEEKVRYTEDYDAFHREAIMKNAGDTGFEYRLSIPQNACRH
jgi:hypothetical protein